MNPTPWNHVDVAHFGAFDLPSYICQDCHAISRGIFSCSICNGKNVIDLNTNGFRVENKFNHAAQFGIVESMRTRQWSTKEVIEDIFDATKLYIHFATYSIDAYFIGLLESVLFRGVQVTGLVGMPNSLGNASKIAALHELNRRYRHRCNIKVFTNEINRPHQKLLIADGCVAITGSMNLTDAGIKKHSSSPPCEFAWPFTDIDSVIAVNNEYISPHFLSSAQQNHPMSVPPALRRDIGRYLSLWDRRTIMRIVLDNLSNHALASPLMPPKQWRRQIYDFLITLRLKRLDDQLMSFVCTKKGVILYRRYDKMGPQALPKKDFEVTANAFLPGVIIKTSVLG